MPVLDSSLVSRRGTIRNSVAALHLKGRNLSPADVDLIGKLEEELRTINNQIGDSDDESHARAFGRYLRYNSAYLKPGDLDDLAFAEKRGVRVHYRAGQHVSTRLEWRASAGVDNTPLGGAYPGSSGGYFASLDFIKKVTSAAKATAPWLDISDVIWTATGSPVVLAADNDIAVSAAQIAEAGADSAQDITMVATALGSYRFTSKVVKVSKELIMDSGIDLTEYLAGRFAARMMRGLDPIFTNANGSNQPTGALYGLTPSVTIMGSSDTDSTSGANTIGLQDLVATEQALDPAYRAGATWLMHPNTLAALRKVKDKNNQPVFGSLNRPEGPILLGYPVVIAPSMDQLQSTPSSPAVSRVPLAFGNVRYFKIRMTQPTMVRLEQLYAAQHQTGFILNWRCDSSLVDGASSNRAVVTAQSVY